MSRVAKVGWVLFALDGILIAASVVITRSITTLPPGLEAGGIDVYSISVATFGLLGAVIMMRQPANRYGWLLAAIALIHAAGYFMAGLAARSLYSSEGPAPWGPYVAWVFVWSASLHYAPSITLLLLLFPDGAPPSRRWRPVAWLVPIGTILAVVGVATLSGPLPVYSDVENPFGLVGPLPLVFISLGLILLTLAAIASAGSLGVRYRTARGDRRQQLKWFFYGGALVVACVVGIVILGVRIIDATTIISAALSVLAVGAGIGITRYHLYEIDVVINRTLVYGATTAVVAVTFFVGILALQALLRPLTSGSEVAVAAATLVSFALVQPVRRSVQNTVDRRFYRARYDAARTLDLFTERLREEVDLDALRADLIGALRTTVGPAHASLWLRGRPDER